MTTTPAMPDLTAVIKWLENGCDPREAVKELKHYQSKLQALATLQAQPAEVSDAELRKTIDALRDPGTVSAFYNGYYTLTPDELRRAILALRPQAVPMTDEPVKVVPYTEWHRGDVLRITSEGRDIGPFEEGQLVRHDDEDGDNAPYCRSLNGDYRYALIHDQLEFVSTEARHGITAPAGGEGHRG